VRDADFEVLAKLLAERSGLVLTGDKTYLLESRLTPVARKRDLENLDKLVEEVRMRPTEALLHEITEAMTTNETFFFRDNTPFDMFRENTLPLLLETRASAKHIRIWCAAASTGQEPYSIAMMLKEEAAKIPGWRVDILGTDISPTVLEKAKAGLYSQFEVQRGLPIQLLVKNFQQVNEMWQIDSAIRAMVRYQECNLLEDITRLGQFDVVFCRNVLIYFDQETKGRVLANVAKMLTPEGVLFLGGAETVLGISDKFKPLPGQRGVYGVVT
jgi:chemotaxis protein methyltransferase CheR